MTALEAEQRRARRFGWTALTVWAAVGLVLEAMHGFKVSAYLDDEMTRMLLRLAHAHGVGLAVVTLVHGVSGAPLFADRADGGRRCGALLRAGALLVPVGFALGVVGHPESDPGLGILLLPIGAACLLAALAWTTHRALTGGRT